MGMLKKTEARLSRIVLRFGFLFLAAERIYQRLRLLKEKVLDLGFRKITLIQRLSRKDTGNREVS